MRKMMIATVLVGVSVSAFAQVPKRTESGSMLQAAQAKGYSFEIVDVTLAYDPKFVDEAKSSVIFSLTNIKRNGKAIVITDDKSSPDRFQKLSSQFNDVCHDVFEISGARVPGGEVKWQEYQYNSSNEIVDLSCSIVLPAK